MNAAAGPERLAALAALITPNSGAGPPGPVSIDELDLARAIRGDTMTRAHAAAIAELLRLADQAPLAGALRRTLRETFLGDDPGDHAAAFGAVFWRFAMPGLSADAKEHAARLLAGLGG